MKSILVTTVLRCFLVPLISSGVLASDRTFVAESLETKVALIELFSSEGCSSCPPAEAWIGSLKDDPGLWKHFVPVAFHVDYWNHLGWTDTFALPEFTQHSANMREVGRRARFIRPVSSLTAKNGGRGVLPLPSQSSRPESYG